jgi:hexosaminidase
MDAVCVEAVLMRKLSRLRAAVAVLTVPIGAFAAAAQQMPPPPHKPVPFDQDVRTWVVPALREWRSKPGEFSITDNARIVIPRGASQLQPIAEALSQQLRWVTGVSAEVAVGRGRPGDIVLSLNSAVARGEREGYVLTLDQTADLAAATTDGARMGTQTLLQMLKRSPTLRSLPHGVATDWPDQRVRAMFVDVGRKYYEVGELEDLIRQMAWLKLNTLGLHFTDWPAFRLRSARFPGLAARQSYDRNDIMRLQATAQRYGIAIIPEIDLPAHATALIQYRPNLAFRCESMRQSDWLTRSAQGDTKALSWTVDITRSENREFLQSILREFVPWFTGEYFHIGGDEYQYDVDKNRCPELVDYARSRGFAYPGDVFVDWVNETDGLIRALGKKTAMWSWWRFKDDKTSIQPNKDILVYAWNAPRTQDMLAEGYNLIVTPEDKLYAAPGIENWDGSGYGRVDTNHVYREMPFPRSSQIVGYMVALWADAAESWTDRAMLATGYEPMAVLAERGWAGARSPTLDAFRDRLNRTSSAPAPAP